MKEQNLFSSKLLRKNDITPSRFKKCVFISRHRNKHVGFFELLVIVLGPRLKNIILYLDKGQLRVLDLYNKTTVLSNIQQVKINQSTMCEENDMWWIIFGVGTYPSLRVPVWLRLWL